MGKDNKIKANKVLFIKLGDGGKFEKECIEDSQTLKLSYREVEHDLCINREWNKIKDFYVYDRNSDVGAAQRHVNQIRQFYEEDENTLWITFYADKLWWCFSKPEIELLSDNTKIRPVIGKWSDKDINGNVLLAGNISGNLLKTQGFRGTICSVEEAKYALNKINNEQSKEIIEVEKAYSELNLKLIHLIKKLQPKDFEILVDLIFRQAGWQRTSDLGKQQKTLDLALISPLTGERAIVQIKTGSNLNEFLDYEEQFVPMKNDYDKFFYVVHSAKPDLVNYKNESETKLYLVDKIAELSISLGLVEWIIKKVS